MRIDKSKDTFGMDIMAYFKNENVTGILERSDGFIEAVKTSVEKYFHEFDKWDKSNQEIMKFIKGKTLDLGCAAGRVGKYLEANGIDYVGIDNSPLSIEVCQNRGLKNTHCIPIEEIEKIGEKQFKSITMFGANFGLLGNPQKGKKILQELYKLTDSDANIIAHSTDVTKTNISVHKKYQDDRLKEDKLRGELTLRWRHQNIKGPWFDYLLATPDEMNEIVKDTGWQVKEIIQLDESPQYYGIIEKI